MKKQVFITGVSSDIGLALCHLYIDAGYKVVGQFNRGRAELDSLFAMPDVTGFKIDFSNPDETERQIIANGGVIGKSDVLINLAGTYEPVSFGSVTAKNILTAITVNLIPAVLLAQAIGPAMASRGWGRIVNISSIGVKFGGGSNSFCYALSKHALEFMPTAHKQWAASNVLMNTLRVGVTETRFHHLDPGKDMTARISAIPAKRMASTQEIAEAIFWFGSEKNGYTTGQVVSVAGGE